MSDRAHPFLVVPTTADFAHVFDKDLARIRVAQRARDVGVVVLMPRTVQPATLMFAAMMWPNVLRGTGVVRVAVVLHIGAFAQAKPLLGGCQRRLHAGDLHVEFFHEAQVESGALTAWAERARRRKRVTTDQLVKVCERYAERGDLHNAILALRLAEENAEIDDAVDAFAAQAVKRSPVIEDEPPHRETAELPQVA